VHLRTLRYLAIFFLLPHFVIAQATESTPPSGGLIAHLTSPPRDLLGKLYERGASVSSVFIYDWSKDFDDDAESSGFGRYSIDVSMALDGKKLVGLEGSEALVRVKTHMSHFGDAYENAAQVASNIDGPSRTSLYEVWFQQRLFSNKLRLKAGKIDANTEFATVATAGDFLNSSMGYSPTIMAFPSYPEPKLAFNAFVVPATSYNIGVGVFQTAGMGPLSILEGGRSWSLGNSEHPGRGSLGYWRAHGMIDRFDGDKRSGTQGVYSVVEQSLLRSAAGMENERSLTAFLQIGQAPGDVSPITSHIGGGLVLQGPFHRRNQDGVGTAVTWVHFSSDPAAGFDFGSELAVETYYKVVFSKHFAFVQDFQYLHHARQF